MKFFISLIVSLNLQAATPYFLIYSLNQEADLEVIKILEEHYGVQKEFIKVRNTQCHTSKQYLAAHLCINKKGELKILSLNKKILIKLKEVFKRLR